jgi:hypothetical protein
MLTPNFFLKLILTPLIIVAATLVSRKWGERIGGLMIGLPLTSAPVSFFFAIEQSRLYAANAAKGSILGLVPVAVFCASYVRSARRLPWYSAAAFSILLYLVAVFGMSLFGLDLAPEVILVSAMLGLAMLLLGKMDSMDHALTSPWWDLPLRAIVATTLVVSITTGAGALGSKWGGLLSPFPIFTFVMATFSHSQGGPAAAWRLIRGVLTGLFGYVAFFVVINLLVEQTNLAIVYSLATLAALGVNGLSLLFLVRRNGHIVGAIPK